VWENLSVRLDGSVVVLEPLQEHHGDGLFAASRSPEIWQWLPDTSDSREAFDAWFAASVEASRAGTEAAFATIERSSDRPIGSTRYLSLRPEHRGVEIGYSWLSPAAWGTGANVEAKLLMCDHAFRDLGCMRVEFKTDARNERSRAALLALPARFEGIFRKHMLVPAGVRDSAYYSITDAEWPSVRANLVRRLDAAIRGRAEAASATRAS
jgi:N-acetyltransferase